VEYMAMIYEDEARWAGLSEDERDAIRDRYNGFTQKVREAGVMVGGNALGSTGDATTVRVRDEETLVTDGPYSEVKEALGGYYLFECATIDEAVVWAAGIPSAEHGFVEVRPVYSDPTEEVAP
jgi:hypothetical protein